MKDTGSEKYTLLLETLRDFIKMRSSLDRVMAPITQAYGLTPMQSAILNLINSSSDVTVSSLFRSFDLNQGNMSTLCKKLENDGYIIKTRASDDERRSYLALTDKGRYAINAINSALSYSEEECWLTHEELKEAEEALLVLRSALGKVNEKFVLEFGMQGEDSDAQA